MFHDTWYHTSFMCIYSIFSGRRLGRMPPLTSHSYPLSQIYWYSLLLLLLDLHSYSLFNSLCSYLHMCKPTAHKPNRMSFDIMVSSSVSLSSYVGPTLHNVSNVYFCVIEKYNSFYHRDILCCTFFNLMLAPKYHHHL